MKNKILAICVFAICFFNPLYALTGNTALACEALLCLSAGAKPTECKRSIKKFFSISAKKPWKTLQLRRNFLALCPTQSSDNISDDVLMEDYKNALVQIPHECTAEALNKVFEYSVNNGYYPEKNCSIVPKDKFVRITKTLPQSCINFINSTYSDLKMPKNICDDKYYKLKDFNRGYYETITNKSGEFANTYRLDKASKPSSLWQTLYNQNKSQVSKYRCYYTIYGENRDRTYYYDVYMQKHKINKECWVY